MQNILKKFKQQELRYILFADVRITPFNNSYHANSKVSTLFENPTAEICLIFGSYSLKYLILSCHDTSPDLNSECYKLRVDEVSGEEQKNYFSSYVDMNSQIIEEWNVFEDPIHTNDMENFDKSRYLSNALLIKFERDKYLSIVGTTDGEPAVPKIWLHFFHADEYPVVEIHYLNKWVLKQKI